MRSATVLLGFVALAGCSPASGGGSFCELGAEHEVARTAAKDFDAIELVPLGDGALALYSTEAGLFGEALDREGRPRGPLLRLGVRCEGGLDALPDGDGVEVACLLHPARGKHSDRGGVLLHRIDRALTVQRTRLVGSSGPQSEGVALARGTAGLELAWHEGSAEVQRVLWSALDADGAAEPRAVSDDGRSAKAPTLAPLAGRTWLAWAETWIEDGELGSRIALWEPRAGTRTLLPRAHVAAMPQLFSIGDEAALGYRERKAGEKTGLHLSSFTLSEAGAGVMLGHSMRVGRADGVGRPAIAPCMEGVVVATPRTYGGDYFVGVNWLDRELTRTRGEQQFYEDSHAFTQVAAACLGAHALLLIAEFPQLHSASSALRAVPYRCR